jgi:hypothetical protein
LWLALGVAFCLAVPAEPAGQTGAKQSTASDRTRAENELKEGTRAYAARDFLQAQAHYQAALDLDPTQKAAAFLLARSIHAQYRPALETPENVSKAREAIAAYQRVVADNPNHEEAYQAVVLLYEAIHEDAQQREWILKRARQETLPSAKRAAAYALLVGKDWECANRIMEPADSRPAAQANDDAAKQCTARGLDMAQKAIGLDPESMTAWSYKTKLLLAMAKFAEREGQTAQKADYTKQAAAAQARTAELIEKNHKKMEGGKSY